jgi:hypothetical protein
VRRAGQTFADLPVVPIGRTRRRYFVIASEAKQSIAPHKERTACASAMFFLVPRPTVVVSEELMAKAEEEESGML